jgi:hypothetical protein
MRVGEATALLLLCTVPAACRERETPQPPRPAFGVRADSVGGCYSLAVGSFAKASDDSVFAALPSRFELTNHAMTAPFPGNAVVPEELWPGKKMIALWEKHAGDSVTVSWSTGFYGLSLYLRESGDRLVGVARPFSDAHAIGAPPPPEVTVTATRVECVTREAP